MDAPDGALRLALTALPRDWREGPIQLAARERAARLTAGMAGSRP